MHSMWTARVYGERINTDFWVKSTCILHNTMNVMYLLGILSQQPMMIDSYRATMRMGEDKTWR